MVKTLLLWIGTLTAAGGLAAGAWSVSQADAHGRAVARPPTVTPYDPLLRISRVGDAGLTSTAGRPTRSNPRREVTHGNAED